MNKEFNKGLLLAGFGSFWWGFFGVIYFKYIAYIGHIELVVHRCLWTAFTLILTTFFFSKWNIFFKIVKNKSNLFYLFISGFLIFINWGVWIYAIATNRIIDASFGYFIMPILSVMLGYLFFKEKLNKKRIFSILLVVLSILFLIIVSIKSLPWVGLIVALSWGFYNLVRKKINMGTNKLVNNFHLYCDELDKAARDPKLIGYTKKDVIQLIHQIIKDNVLDRIQNRELKEIREVLIDKENSNIINVTDY